MLQASTNVPYVVGDALNSAQAVSNIASLCRASLPNPHDIEVADVFWEPRRALADGILMTPTLVTFAPFPIRRIVRALNQTQTVLEALGLNSPAA